MSSKFCRIDLPLKKPCCRGRTQRERIGSQACLAALAMMRLSEFTMLRGIVLLGVYTGVPFSVVLRDFLGKHTIVLNCSGVGGCLVCRGKPHP